MVEKNKSRGQRPGERKWPTRMVSEGFVSIYLVPIGQGTAERVATQDWQGGHRQVQCGEVMTGIHVVEECPELNQWRPRRVEWREWREALGGRVRKRKGQGEAEEEEVDLLEIFFYHVFTNFFTRFRRQLSFKFLLPFPLLLFHPPLHLFLLLFLLLLFRMLLHLLFTLTSMLGAFNTRALP